MDELDLTEEEIAQLMELGIAPEELDSIKQQKKTAEALRYGDAPEGRDSGRVYTAANPLEHIARAWQGIRSGKELEGLREQEQGVLGNMRAGRGAFMNALMNRGPNRAIRPDTPVGDPMVPMPGQMPGGMPGPIPPPEATPPVIPNGDPRAAALRSFGPIGRGRKPGVKPRGYTQPLEAWMFGKQPGEM